MGSGMMRSWACPEYGKGWICDFRKIFVPGD